MQQWLYVVAVMILISFTFIVNRSENLTDTIRMDFTKMQASSKYIKERTKKMTDPDLRSLELE